MKVFSSQLIREIDSFTIANEPISSINLMERAANQIFRWLNSHFSTKQCYIIFAGPGNNGGDGLALARMLAQSGNEVKTFLCHKNGRLTEDCETNKNILINNNIGNLQHIDENSILPKIQTQEIVIDALFGSGLSKPLEGFYEKLVNHINKSKKKSIISIDIPSGLFGEDNSNNLSGEIIKADITLSLQFPKLSFFFAENRIFTGEWHILPIGLHKKAIEKTETPFFFQQKEEIKFINSPRKTFSHKGNFGHVLLIAGSIGKMGAAVLASKACLRVGCGLLTTHIPEKGHYIMQIAIPEAMVSIDYSTEYFSMVPELKPYSVIAIGPGISQKVKTKIAFADLLQKTKSPMVIDADAINLLAANKELIKLIPKNSILTPHPGEFERLIGNFADGFSKLTAQINFSKKQKLIVVLKGAHTSISLPNGSCIFNSTGNPGMATAGSGDVLTGIIAGLLAQGFSPEQSAQAGVFLHGLAGDIAKNKIGEKSIIASDLIDFLPEAFVNIQQFAILNKRD
ncbi:MAG: NAD(P)H-hydrate dehydratase [Bacteroidales bacterium]|nr:NAD(P)H-hydrate dehydratase [Bacteroidales bacterium]